MTNKKEALDMEKMQRHYIEEANKQQTHFKKKR